MRRLVLRVLARLGRWPSRVDDDRDAANDADYPNRAASWLAVRNAWLRSCSRLEVKPADMWREIARCL